MFLFIFSLRNHLIYPMKSINQYIYSLHFENTDKYGFFMLFSNQSLIRNREAKNKYKIVLI